MMLSQNKTQMSLLEFRGLRDFIYQKSGIFFNESKMYFLENRLSKRIQELNLKNYQAYLELIKGPTSREELKWLFVEITTNETSFWRNPPQIEAFQRIVLPSAAEMAKARGQSRLRIWSAACSSGEEPYTLAMVCLDEKDACLRHLGVEILATDISEKVLKMAEEGLYNSYTMRNLSPVQIKKYFKPLQADQFQVTADMKSLVSFRSFNLVDYPLYRTLGTFDVIFCRNVLIYFDDAVKGNVLKGFHGQLAPSGYLLVGHSESIHAFNSGFELLHFSKAMGYRKKG